MCRLSWNLGAWASWNPQGLSRPVIGLLYLFFTSMGIGCRVADHMCQCCNTRLSSRPVAATINFHSTTISFGSLLLSSRALLVEAVRHKSKGRGCDSRWCHWNFFIDIIFRSRYGPGFDSASNRIEYQEYILWDKGGRCVRLTTFFRSVIPVVYLRTK